MNNNNKGSKTPYIILTIVVIFLVLAYLYWSGTKVPDSLTLDVSIDTQAVGSRVLRLLNEIDSLHVDSSLFSDSSYKTLRDYTVDIPSLPVGRPNPFSPIPGVAE